MSLSDLPIFGMFQQKMSWLGNRQDVLARNIANASTPGYVPQDLKAQDFRSVLSAAQGDLVTTNPLHIQPRAGAALRTARLRRRDRSLRPTATPSFWKSRR